MSDPARAPDPAWTRAAFEAGGGDALVFYAVYADAQMAPSLDVSPERHRTRGLPDGMVLAMHTRESAEFTDADFAVGASEQAYRAAGDAELQFVVGGIARDPLDLTYLRDVIGVVAALVDAGATAVFDLQTLTLLTADEFMREVFACDAPDGDVHVAVFASDDARPGHVWLHTRGMRKFGRPDVSMRGVPEAGKLAAAEIVHRYVTRQILGARVAEDERVVVDGRVHTCHHGGRLDDPDFNNVHVEIRES